MLRGASETFHAVSVDLDKLAKPSVVPARATKLTLKPLKAKPPSHLPDGLDLLSGDG